MSHISLWDMVKYTVRGLDYKLEQYRLSTGATITTKIAKGQIKGTKRMSVWGNSYYSFEGIPFAKPPLGDLRFRAPVEEDPWDDVLDCTGPASIPFQGNMIFKKYKGSEDCLYLNVFTNDLTPAAARPVMVWIYGGGFQLGEATRDMYSPDYFMSKDVVLVTIAYRLGPFGFLSLDDPSVDVPGNAGIKDQIMALKWVQNNIASFGGDPNNVTLFGESAGGASTHLCMVSERSKGLIHKAIAMSGSMLCPWVFAPPSQWAFRLAKALGYDGDEKAINVYKFLKDASPIEIQKAIPTILTREEKHNRIMLVFGPVIEPYRTKDCIIADPISECLQNTWSNDIPMILGGTSFEGLLFYPEIQRRKATLDEVKDCVNLLPMDLSVDRRSTKAQEMGVKLKKAYFGDEECSSETMWKFLELCTYREFWHPLYRTARYRMLYAKAPTYVYRFDYDSADSNAIRRLICGEGVRGACHGDDMVYLFRFMFSNRMPMESLDCRVAKAMVDIWTSFAANSDPNCLSLGDVKVEPLAKDPSMVKCLNISDKIDFIDLPELKKILDVWNDFYPQGKL
ncbi:esterase B1 [Stomoxys calcitrans]|uniref:esterase B1 n=1 Tax=Stomoxys calcitrans TaxID=35570 RepID=UPI0027E39055|nr:esterase B1 [Stomoxys calcitrans]XP_013117938.2 esterase B1 [Stomoxys calcitrans]XP_013118006.2 esterase B1 [Stomoxys calcitrans]XP_013118144.2 esterase B1 [Stomoxys calcitrans]XP_013118209.2 esterase B1 [Stomoxys calcitrans]XP_013118243.2 esterase B1 [Stomoxys calcitrans]XP_013118249.2 esterase B1 [Stomoxys calcitrans]XP_013118255.2 esterase B1 [Stomoxys calcitrans]XP_013118261.2 esterase B1 [Stomoxys calcitrans]XP_013118269.2 esterase B1 [Stomoxys calcitrans]XP_059219112.1 esterase B